MYVHLCMCVCMCVRLCVYVYNLSVYTLVHLCVCIRVYVHTSECTCVRVCVHMCVCVYISVHTWVHLCVSLYWDILHPASLHTHCMSVWVCTLHACVHVYICLWPCACMSVGTCVYMYLCLYACGHLPVHVCVWVRCSHPGEDPPGGHSCQAAQSPPQGCLCPARLPAVPGRGLDSPHGIQDLSPA